MLACDSATSSARLMRSWLSIQLAPEAPPPCLLPKLRSPPPYLSSDVNPLAQTWNRVCVRWEYMNRTRLSSIPLMISANRIISGIMQSNAALQSTSAVANLILACQAMSIIEVVLNIAWCIVRCFRKPNCISLRPSGCFSISFMISLLAHFNT